ncbi:hypothetical protein [Argonema galeatum]|uniref:hypothetical protein n=1 Tax=Argonema galeatum TaxID=2942762 RepID=UPI0020123F32|nr:hypothetical protein [Argonema galeatum]MCL1467150.1 hypothetical protein [Argonema galeatum A003/A1]
MVLLFLNGDTFATGAARYDYRPATEGEVTNRIILQVDIAGILIEAVVDTGAPYVVLAPRIARIIGLSPASAIGRERMLIRGMRLDGNIYRFSMKLVAELGEDEELEATIFVPDSEEYWGNFPSFIGLGGFLERVRFAVDPSTDMFYFGSLALS